MGAVIEIVLGSGVLALLHVVLGSILGSKQSKKHVQVLFLSTLITFLILCTIVGLRTCAGRVDILYCTLAVIEAGLKIGIVFIPLILLFGFLGFRISSRFTRSKIAHAKDKE